MLDFQNNLIQNIEHKTFDLSLVDRLQLDSYTKNGQRFYNTPIGNVKSVTTIISEYLDKTWLENWRARIGEVEANGILETAKRRGRAIHTMAEDYIQGRDFIRSQHTVNIMDFRKVIPILNHHIDKIYGIELPLYSHNLKTAGTADLVCRWDMYPTILDFKTARKPRDLEQIEGYFIQASCYAMMFEELYNLHMDKIVIIMLVDHEDKPEIYEDYVYPHWSKKVNKIFKK